MQKFFTKKKNLFPCATNSFSLICFLYRLGLIVGSTLKFRITWEKSDKVTICCHYGFDYSAFSNLLFATLINYIICHLYCSLAKPFPNLQAAFKIVARQAQILSEILPRNIPMNKSFCTFYLCKGNRVGFKKIAKLLFLDKYSHIFFLALLQFNIDVS